MTDTTIGAIIGGITTIVAIFFGANGYFQSKRTKAEIPEKVETVVTEKIKPVEQRFEEATTGLETVLPLIQQMQRRINNYEEDARTQKELWAKVMIAWARHESWDQRVGDIARKVDPTLPEPPSLSDLLK